MKKLTILAALLGIFAMVSVAGAQEDLGVTFDEAGTVTMTDLVVGGVFAVYAVAFDLPEVSGFEFQLITSVPAGANLAPVVYGPNPQNFGDSTINEIRAGTGGCVSVPFEMGASPLSWTLTKFEMIFFAPATDVNFCLGAAPTGGAVPQYTICDVDATKLPMVPANVDLAGVAPDGCAVASPTQGQDVVDAPTTSWGSLKAGF